MKEFSENSKKIFKAVLDLIQKKSFKPEDVMIVFRKRNKVIEDVLALFRANGMKIYSKNYISSLENESQMEKFFTIVFFMLDLQDEYKLALLLRSQIFFDIDAFEKAKLYFLHFDFVDFLDLLLHFSFQKSICFEPEFLQYLILIWESFSQIQSFQDEQSHIFEFIRYLKNNEVHVLENSKESWSGDCVRLLTIHSSKGLEADYVVFFDDFSDFLEDSKDDRFCFFDEQFIFYNFKSRFFDQKIKTPEISKILQFAKSFNENASDAKSEEKRLLYVALTRAKKNLTIVCANDEIRKKYQEILLFTNAEFSEK